MEFGLPYFLHKKTERVLSVDFTDTTLYVENGVLPVIGLTSEQLTDKNEYSSIYIWSSYTTDNPQSIQFFPYYPLTLPNRMVVAFGTEDGVKINAYVSPSKFSTKNFNMLKIKNEDYHIEEISPWNLTSDVYIIYDNGLYLGLSDEPDEKGNYYAVLKPNKEDCLFYTTPQILP